MIWRLVRFLQRRGYREVTNVELRRGIEAAMAEGEQRSPKRRWKSTDGRERMDSKRVKRLRIVA